MEEKIPQDVEPTLEWSQLIQQLTQYTKTNTYHQLLSPLRLCVKLLDKKLVDYTKSHFSNDLKILLDACKLLDSVAFEKTYREQVGNMILIPIERSLKAQSRLSKIIINFIKSKLPFKPYGDSKLSTLCSHEMLSFSDCLKENILIKLHDVHMGYLQKTPEVYDEAILVISVLDYWRLLKSNSPEEFNLSNIQHLLVLGENILSIAQHEKLSLKGKECWRLVLLLQILLYEHSGLSQLNPAEWPEQGFVLSLLESQYYKFHKLKTIKRDSSLLVDNKSRLAFLRRNILHGKDILENQRQHSKDIIQLLRDTVLAISEVLGEPPCSLAICVLGSTSRLDRRPYSDVEIMLLHSEDEKGFDKHRLKKRQAQVFVYINYFLSIFELMIARLGETHDLTHGGNAGFHLDSSCHILKKKIWGTPEDVVKRFIINPTADKTNQTHPWLDNESFYALLEPMLVHPGELGADALLQKYKEHLKIYLQSPVLHNDEVEIITSRFNLTNIPAWYQGLTRQQVIAMVCLRDVVEKSIQTLDPDKLAEGQIINLKKVYYKPLAYCAMNIRLYHDWPLSSPFEILQFYVNRLSWGGEAIEAWYKAALSCVVQEQIRLHFDNAYQEEEVVYRLKRNSDQHFWSGMDLIQVGFIKPLQQVIHKWFAGERSQIENWGYSVLQIYLNSRQSWLERWVKKGLDRNRLLRHPLITVLASYPDRSSWSPMMTLRLSEHLKSLEPLFQAEETHCQIAGLPIFEWQKTYLPEMLIEKCFSHDGQFQGDQKYSGINSQVRLIDLGGKKWFIKVKEGNKTGLMGREYAVMMLHLLLGGEPQIALGWPIKLIYTNQHVKKIYWAWISEPIEGDSLGYVMLNLPERLKKDQIDSVSFGLLFLLSYLCCPEDGQPENFKAQHTAERKTRLITFDYGHCFVQAKAIQKVWFGSNKEVLILKTMVFLLESMDDVLAAEIITRLRLLEIEEWFEQWKSAINNINQFFKPLLQEDLTLKSERENPQLTNLVDIDDGVFHCIKFRLELLQHWLRSQAPFEKISGSKILSSLEPLVAIQYQSLRPQIKTPNDFYTKIDVKAYIKDSKSGKMVSSTTFVNLQQKTITPERLQQSCGLKPRYFRRVDFGTLDKIQQEFTLKLLEATAEHNGDQFWELNLLGCAVIKQDRLFQLLGKMPNLEILDIRNCLNLSVVTLYNLFSNSKIICLNLKEIKVNVANIEQSLIVNLEFRERQQLKLNIKGFINGRVTFLERLWNTIEDKNDSVRLSALNALAQLSRYDEDIRTILLKNKGNEKWIVRRSVAEIFGESKYWDEEIHKTLLKMMEDKNEVVCSSAVRALGQLGHWDEDIQNALLAALDNKSRDIRLSAIKALGQLNHWDANIRTVLLSATKDEDEEIYISALETFRQLNHWDTEILASMLNALKSKNWKLRLTAAKVIGKLKYATHVFDIVLAESGMLNKVIQAGVWLLIANSICNALAGAMKDQNEMVRIAAVIALTEWDNSGQIYKMFDPVIEPEIRSSILVAFGQIGHWNDKIREILLHSLKDCSTIVRQSSLHALGKLGHRDGKIGLAIEIAINDEDDSVCCFAINAVGQLNCWNEAIRATLLKKIEYNNPSIRAAVVKVFGVLNHWDNEIDKALFKASRDEDVGVQIAVIETFGKLLHRNKKMRGFLLKVAGNQKENLRAFALKALGQLEHWDKDILNIMFNSIKDNDVEVSRNSIEALTRYFNIHNSELNLREQVHMLSSHDLCCSSILVNTKIIKRIFFFVSDQRTQRALPLVSRRWRDLYLEFLEAQRLQAAPEVENTNVNDSESNVQDETTQNSKKSRDTYFGL